MSNTPSIPVSSCLSDGNAAYLEDIYEQYLKNPALLEPEWQDYFRKLPQVSAFAEGDISHAEIREQFAQLAKQPHKSVAPAVSVDQQAELIEAYQTYGHLSANINPLHINPPALVPELQSRQSSDPELKGLSARLKPIYCGSIGSEFIYIRNPEERTWIAKRLEAIPSTPLSVDTKKKALQELIAADGLEKYLASKYVGQKRFSLEGGDGFIPLVQAINTQAVSSGVREVVLGMAHRGRLNALINIFGQPSEELFAAFEGRREFGLLSGDVKYHMGYSSDIKTPQGELHLSIAFNPSHLEAVVPVVLGSVRARQQRRVSNKEVLALLVHGDASFVGQGVIMESLQMSQTRAYEVGGAVHIIINNQVGFTTSNLKDARSSRYCTDIAKMIDAPVFHVNGDDPEALIHVARLAVDYRTQYNKDVFIDLVCYRRLGHNEADEPAATQPLMYHFIRQHPVPYQLYAQRLIQQQICTQEEVDGLVAGYRDTLDAGKAVIKTEPEGLAHHHKTSWNIYRDQNWQHSISTTVDKAKLIELAKKMEVLPPEFEVQRQVANALAARAQMTEGKMPLDWGYAETLAYATLVDAGYPVRMSGQDCRRGTFSHRHATLHDQKTGHTYTPLRHLSQDQATFNIYDSLLSEMSVVGFEYGYASTQPGTLVLWEAQYGDFANGAQIMFDQFLSAAWQKWGTLCGLTLLLPHGHEGAGPEHTSARLERFLQLCAQDNMQVCVPTTPAQIFHLLRRQVIRPYRAPLVIMSPKSLLRSKLAVSTMDELATGEFQTVIPEVGKHSTDKVNRIILCSGKVYYDLITERDNKKLTHIAIFRIEQLYPFPKDILQKYLQAYENVREIIWCQEEPENQGAWRSIQHYLKNCLTDKQTLQYAGRPESASPAAGYAKLHEKQQAELIQKALA